MEFDVIIDLLKEHGIVGIILAICIFSIYKLSIYIKDLVADHKSDIKELMLEHKNEREVIMKEFAKSISRLETENRQSNEKLTNLYNDLKLTLEKLITTFTK